MWRPTFRKSARSTLATALGAASISACALLFGATAAANASVYTVTMQQVGFDVFATGSGRFDLTALSQISGPLAQSAGVAPLFANLHLSSGSFIIYSGISGPTSFGPGNTFTDTSSAFGFPVGVIGSLGELHLPTGYISNLLLPASSDTFANMTLASLGVIPGDYVWTWGSGTDQGTFELDIVGSVPLPAALPLFASGLVGLLLLSWRRKKKTAAG
jgi:hypothetical protein